MSISINGSGGGFSPGRRPLGGRKRRARPPPVLPAAHEGAVAGQMDEAWLPEQFRAELDYTVSYRIVGRLQGKN